MGRFIEKYGTHIIVGISIGGQDVIMLKQSKSSHLEASQLKNHLEDLGDQLFNGACTFSPHQLKNKDKNKVRFRECNKVQTNISDHICVISRAFKTAHVLAVEEKMEGLF